MHKRTEATNNFIIMSYYIDKGDLLGTKTLVECLHY